MELESRIRWHIIMAKVSGFFVEIMGWLYEDIRIKRGTIPLIFFSIFGFSFAHQVIYGIFDPYLYIFLLVMALAGIMFLGRRVNCKWN